MDDVDDTTLSVLIWSGLIASSPSPPLGPAGGEREQRLVVNRSVLLM